MRWLLTFLAGVVVGAAGLFAWLRQLPHEAPPAPAAAGVEHLPAPPPAAAADQASMQFPPAPTVEPDLTEVDLPLKPDPEVKSALASVPQVDAGSMKLLVPVEGIKASQVQDTFGQPRGKERRHEALDIMAPKGTRVLAAADGKVVKLFNSKPGGLTVYQFDPGEKYAYYYAHLDRYAEGIKEGIELKRGDLLGYVGSTGNAKAEAPHLHFAVVELTPQKQWWKGTAVNPYPMLEK